LADSYTFYLMTHTSTGA